MGSGASISSIESLTKEQTGDLVAGIGQAYEAYRDVFISEGIDGIFFAKLSESEIKETLNDLGITKPLHQRNICLKLQALKEHNTSNPNNATGNGNVAHISNALDVIKNIASVVADLDMPARVSKTPRLLMTELFAIQGIALDPSDLDPAIDKISSAVGSSGGVCDGVKTYDVFINYRVAADADLAEKLYLYLKTKGISAFLDQKCLKAGEPWKEGFLSGLSRSRKFLCLMSSDALANVRNLALDHAADNVLLEYETALMIRSYLAEKDADMARSYVLPILVGHYSQGVLTKFMDFSPALYPDSVGVAVAVTAAAEKLGARNSPRGTSAAPVPADLSTIVGALAALRVQSLGPAEAEAALKAISNLCLDDNAVKNRALFRDNGGCALILGVFRRFANNNAFVAHQACRVVANAVIGIGTLNDEVVEAGACEVIVAAMTAHLSNADVSQQGCRAMNNTAGGTGGADKRRDQLVAAGACEVIVAAMKAHPSNVDVAQWGCRAINNTAGGTDGADKRRDQLVAAGACEVIVAAMKAHPSSAGVAQWCCGAILEFCWSGNAVIREKLAGLLDVNASSGALVVDNLVRQAKEILSETDPGRDVTFPAGVVALKNHRGVGHIFADSSVRFHGFNTVVGDVRLTAGRYYYEIEVLTMGLETQFGWATESFDAVEGHSSDGVGDDKYSWGVDGHRAMKWHNGKEPFGKKWVAGDVVGCALDLITRTISFSVNGDFSDPCGVAFTFTQGDLPAGWVQPAMTATSGKYRVNFGEADRPFKYAPPADAGASSSPRK